MQLIATDNRKVVVGLGATGLSCIRYLVRKQELFTVVDSRSNPPGLEALKTEFPDVDVELGDFDQSVLSRADQLVVSPGVSLEEPSIKQAIDDGVLVCGDIDLFCSEAKAPVVAITGSNGKSTVTTLVGAMAEADGKKVAVGGNLGVPALELLPGSGSKSDSGSEPDLYVLELSSFQLERSGDLDFEIATVLNVSADHMDRYKGLLDYHQAKHRIFRGCHQVVINRGDSLSKPLIPDDVKVWTFGLNKPDFNGFGLLSLDGVEYLAFEFEKLMPVTDLKTTGRHNIENALAALALGKAAGLAIEAMLAALKSFKGLDHRCQFVAMVNDVRYFNDSKGTNVGAAIASISGIGSSLASANKIILIAGGDAKGADFSPLLAVIKKHIRAVVLIGDAADVLQGVINNVVEAITADSMDSAVFAAQDFAQHGDAVLLSPACASFDMFDSYQHRGEMFMTSVKKILAEEDVN